MSVWRQSWRTFVLTDSLRCCSVWTQISLDCSSCWKLAKLSTSQIGSWCACILRWYSVYAVKQRSAACSVPWRMECHHDFMACRLCITLLQTDICTLQTALVLLQVNTTDPLSWQDADAGLVETVMSARSIAPLDQCERSCSWKGWCVASADRATKPQCRCYADLSSGSIGSTCSGPSIAQGLAKCPAACHHRCGLQTQSCCRCWWTGIAWHIHAF